MKTKVLKKKRLLQDKTFPRRRSVCFRRGEGLRRLRFIQKKRPIHSRQDLPWKEKRLLPERRGIERTKVLADFHCYTAPKKGAAACWCGSCAIFLDGFEEKLNKFYLMIVAALWTTAQRLYPPWSASHSFPDRAEVDDDTRSKTFNLKHGAASHCLDRMSLHLYGLLPELYQDDQLGMFFCVVLARIAINQSEQFEEFTREYQSCVGDLPRPASWNLDVAWEILRKFPFNMGKTARFLPQHVCVVSKLSPPRFYLRHLRQQGLDQLLPKCGANGNLHTQTDRLSKLTCWLNKRLSNHIPSILTGLGGSVNLQFTHHYL